MAMNERIVNGVAVIELSRKFLNDPQVSDFLDRLSDLKESGAYNVVTDLGGVNYISSAGAGALVGGAKSLREDRRLKAGESQRTYRKRTRTHIASGFRV